MPTRSRRRCNGLATIIRYQSAPSIVVCPHPTEALNVPIQELLRIGVFSHPGGRDQKAVAAVEGARGARRIGTAQDNFGGARVDAIGCHDQVAADDRPVEQCERGLLRVLFGARSARGLNGAWREAGVRPDERKFPRAHTSGTTDSGIKRPPPHALTYFLTSASVRISTGRPAPPGPTASFFRPSCKSTRWAK